MSFAAVAIGVGAAATIGGAVVSADAQKSAAKKNAAAQQSAQDQNYQMWLQSRGSEGNAVLPLYLTQHGDTFENILGKDVMDAYDTYHKGQASLTDYQRRLDAFNPSIEGARKTTNDIFGSGVQDEMLSNFKPVAKARVQYKRGAAIDALGKTMQEISAIQSGKGYAGDSLANNLLRFQGRKSAGDAVADANVQNAEDERNIRDSALKLRLNSLQLPYAMAKQDADIFNLPNDTYIDQLTKEQTPFNFFRIGTGTAPQRQPVRYDANPSATQLALQGVGGASSAALNYFLQQKQQQNYLDALQQQQMLQTGFTTPNYNPGQASWLGATTAPTASVGEMFGPNINYEAAPAGMF